RGRGGHAATPHLTADPIVAGAGRVMALQTIISRNRDPHDAVVMTVGTYNAGKVGQVIPDHATLTVDIRTFNAETRRFIEKRIKELARAQAESYGVTAEIDYRNSYPVTVNSPAEAEFARQVALQYAGSDRVVTVERPY